MFRGERLVIHGFDNIAIEPECIHDLHGEVVSRHRLIARGVPAEFIQLANDKLAAINTAYEKIQQERGLKPQGAG